ncbi:hypothetical protein BER93_13120 [Xanthomonas fragariae]|nr:hypothetical protein BER92_13095 [Xanthomonas fragariae]AOD18895.1 hypothetical protein BER93_13120 [Xanthomonas fragariae]ENZ96794.1 hypothetical protein O1K_02436 [Xanthomonas fragariae LMG 25863]
MRDAAAARRDIGRDIEGVPLLQGSGRAHRLPTRPLYQKPPMRWARGTPTSARQPVCYGVAHCVLPIQWRRSGKRLRGI